MPDRFYNNPFVSKLKAVACKKKSVDTKIIAQCHKVFSNSFLV